MRTHTPPHPPPNSSTQCLHHALFMHNLTPGWALLAPPFFAILSAIFTVCIRSWTPGVGNPKSKLGSRAKAGDGVANEEVAGGEATAIPGAVGEGEGQAPPPPYENPREGATVGGDEETMSSAHLFVIGTGFLFLIVFCLFLSALSLQASIFCGGEPDSTTTQVIYWILFLIPCSWASTGLSCWLMLLRDLWGPEMKHKVKINEGSVAMGVIMVIFFPPMFLGTIVGGVMVKGVKWCQRKCCGVDEDEELEVELEEARGRGEGEGEGGSGEEVEEERRGLMGKVHG